MRRLTPRMRFRRLRMPSIRWTRDRGSSLLPWAVSPTRSMSTTIFPAASTLKGKAGEHLLTVRVYDRYENVGVAKTVFGSAAK